MNEQQLYRRPPDPGGYIGGYRWGPSLGGVGLLVLCNLGATQWLAHRFGYQASLGHPFIRVDGIGFYSPFSWIVWLWRYGSMSDPAIRIPLLLSTAMVICGSIGTIAVSALLNALRTKQLTQNTEDLHGSARWASAEDVSATGLLKARRGVYVADGMTIGRSGFIICDMTGRSTSSLSLPRAPAKVSDW